jgi:hypothetical protein
VYEKAKQSDAVPALERALTAAKPRGTGELPLGKRLEIAIRFVQGLPYVSDWSGSNFPDYPKTPEETLVEGFGDCEDKAILLAALLSQPSFDLDPCLVFPPGHTTVAIPYEKLPLTLPYDTEGLFEHNGRTYAYIEAVQPFTLGGNVISDDPMTKDSLVAIYDGQWSHLRPDKFARTFNSYLKTVLPS